MKKGYKFLYGKAIVEKGFWLSLGGSFNLFPSFRIVNIDIMLLCILVIRGFYCALWVVNNHRCSYFWFVNKFFKRFFLSWWKIVEYDFFMGSRGSVNCWEDLLVLEVILCFNGYLRFEILTCSGQNKFKYLTVFSQFQIFATFSDNFYQIDIETCLCVTASFLITLNYSN